MKMIDFFDEGNTQHTTQKYVPEWKNFTQLYSMKHFEFQNHDGLDDG